jgi:hypothetical protein
MKYETLTHFLQSGQLTFILILFALLVALVYTSSTIEVGAVQNSQIEKLYYIIFIPLTLLSFIFALSIACMAQGVQTMEILQLSVSETFGFIGNFIEKMPIRMVVHGIVVLMLTSHIKLKFNFAKQSTTLPDGLEEL